MLCHEKTMYKFLLLFFLSLFFFAFLFFNVLYCFFHFALGVSNLLFALLRFPGPVDVFLAFLLVFSRVIGAAGAACVMDFRYGTVVMRYKIVQK